MTFLLFKPEDTFIGRYFRERSLRKFFQEPGNAITNEEIFTHLRSVEPNIIVTHNGDGRYIVSRISTTSSWPSERTPELALRAYWRKVMGRGRMYTRSGGIYEWNKEAKLFLDDGKEPDYKWIQEVAHGDVNSFEENLLALEYKIPSLAIRMRDEANKEVDAILGR